MTINWFAILGATIVGFAVGFLWYGPLFGKAWMKTVGMTEEDAQQGNMLKIFGISFVCQFIMAYCLAMFFGNGLGAVEGGLYGFLTGFAWVALALTVNSLYEQKPWQYMVINGGYWTVTFTLMGLILGVFN